MNLTHLPIEQSLRTKLTERGLCRPRDILHVPSDKLAAGYISMAHIQ
jgi:hypothetical protein